MLPDYLLPNKNQYIFVPQQSTNYIISTSTVIVCTQLHNFSSQNIGLNSFASYLILCTFAICGDMYVESGQWSLLRYRITILQEQPEKYKFDECLDTALNS